MKYIVTCVILATAAVIITRLLPGHSFTIGLIATGALGYFYVVK